MTAIAHGAAETHLKATDKTLAITMQGERFSVAAERPDIAGFWQGAASGGWEADTLQFVCRHVGPGTAFVDIGAWIGPITLFASRRALRVLAFEPDPVAFGELVRNIAANAGNVEAAQVGIDNREGTLSLFAPSGLGNSVTSSYQTPDAVEIKVPTITLDQVSARLAGRTPVAVKVDIEGHEYNVIDALVAFAKRHRAPMHLSVHPRSYYENCRKTMPALAAKRATWRATRDLIRKLEALGPLTLSRTGTRLNIAHLLRLLIVHRRGKNFSVETSGFGEA